jgi:hypothetical protein
MHCGHNDVAKSSIRGCARGRDAHMAPEATGSIMAFSGVRWLYPITETEAVTLLYHCNQKSMNILARGKPDPLKPVMIQVSLRNYHNGISLGSLDFCKYPIKEAVSY